MNKTKTLFIVFISFESFLVFNTNHSRMPPNEFVPIEGGLKVQKNLIASGALFAPAIASVFLAGVYLIVSCSVMLTDLNNEKDNDSVEVNETHIKIAQIGIGVGCLVVVLGIWFSIHNYRWLEANFEKMSLTPTITSKE